MSINRTAQLDLPPLLSTFAPEMQLILCCARVNIAESFQIHLARLITIGIEWDAVLPLAVRHGVVALLHKHLVESKQSNVPTEFAACLNEQHKKLRVHQLFLTAQMLKVSKLLSEQGIPHLHYKGVVLDQLLYSGQMLRPTGDIDLLVRRDDLFTVRDLLLNIGYRPKLIERAHQERTMLKQYKDYAFLHPQHQCMVEVHWSLMTREFGMDFDFDYFVERQQRAEINRQQLATFGPEEMFLTLAMHGARHQFESLKWLVDLHQFVDVHPEIDWQVIARRAKEERIETMVWLSVDLCKRVLGTQFDTDNVIYPRQARIDSLSKAVCNTIIHGRNPNNMYEHIVFNVRLIDDWWKKIRYICIMAFQLNVKDVAARDLPWYATPFYYVMRAARLIRRRGIGALLRTLGQMLRAIRD